MLKTVVIFLLLAVFSCDQGKKVTDTDNTGGKNGGEQPSTEAKLDLAVVGDSLAVGVFSDIPLDDGDPTTESHSMTETEAKRHPVIGELLKGILLDLKPNAAEIDKIFKQKYENPYTCAGDKSECTFSYQHQAGLANDKVKNAAVSGASVSNLIAQLNQVEKAGNAKTYIVQVGGNDFCADAFNQADYVKGMRSVIDKILGTNSAAKIIIVAIPNIVELFQNVAPAEKKALKITALSGLTRSALGNPEKSEVQLFCRQIRDGEEIANNKSFLPFCPRISEHIPAAPEAEETGDPVADFFAAKRKEIKDANKAVADLVKGYSNTSIKFAASVEEIAFTAVDISADCVHPSRAGQQKLAAAVWAYKF